MILELNGWRFQVDQDRTMAYSAQELEDRCSRDYCRNFYGAVDGAYPGLRPFLARFGVEICAPDELMPYTGELYGAAYAVCGQILQKGAGPIVADGVQIWPQTLEESNINTACPSPCFVVYTALLELPWVLETPQEDVVSPANTPYFLKRMWQNLLKNAPKDRPCS